MSSWFKSAATPLAIAADFAKGMFDFVSSKPASNATNEQKIKAIEKDDDKVIQTIAETAAEAQAAAQGPTATPAFTLYAINANLALDNALSKEKLSDTVNASILKEENDEKEALERKIEKSMQAFIKDQDYITAFRQQCVEEAIKQFQVALSAYGIQVNPKISGDIMKQIAGSWSELLISSTRGDSSIYLSVKTFFFRVNQAIDALLTQCIFLSTKWDALQTALRSLPGTVPPPPSPPPSPPANASYPKVNVGPCWYVVGPILDFRNIEGRIFIYVKCYKTHECTDGIYFWVYGSQSEGFSRVFFKLDPFGSIEKGFDYTQGTFVHLRLQIALCNYYQNNITNTLSVIDTLSGLNLFMSLMPYLQQDSRTNGYHLYKIDDSFASIIKRGFPLHPPLISTNTMNNEWSGVINMICKKRGQVVNRDNQLLIATELQPEWESQCALYFPDNPSHPNYEFSRRRMGYGTTCPYIFCFTTCGLVQSCPIFKLFLSANSYKNTFWCQGFQNYTKMLSVSSNREILSPVLHIVMGALLQKPDMAMSSLRSNMLNIGITSDGRLMSQHYNEATKAIMTLGTRPNFQEPNTSVRIPDHPPARLASFQGLKSIQTKPQDTGHESLGLQFTPGRHRMIKNDQALDAIIKENVGMKINMIKCLAVFYSTATTSDPTNSFVVEVNRLLQYPVIPTHPPAPDRSTTLSSAIAEAIPSATADANPTYYTAQAVAQRFITASPEAAAAALFGYISNPTDFVKDLTDFAHLCLKKEWTGGMMDDAYHASQGVFNPTGAIYNYLGIDGEFHHFDPAAATPPTPLPYVFISSFDEVRKVDTSPTSPDKNANNTTTELNVTVVTFAHIYRVDCGYTEVSSYNTKTPKSMSMLYQISTTIVYTRENPSRILYAVTHRTPLACLPDALEYFIQKFNEPPVMTSNSYMPIRHGMPKNKGKGGIQPQPVKKSTVQEIAILLNKDDRKDQKKKILKEAEQLRQQQEAAEQLRQQQEAEQLRQQQEAAAEELLNSPNTLCTTYGRVTSYGALFAGKMMEYFFGGSNGYYQLPYFFRNFDKFLKVCHQYDSTVLMYLPNVPPYDLLVHHPSALELLPQSIQSYFTTLVITFNTGDSGVDQNTYIQTKLNEYGPHIQAISEYLTKDFMVDTSILDEHTDGSQSSSYSQSTDASTTSMSSTSSDAIEYIFKELFEDYSGTASEATYNPESQDSLSPRGGTLPIKYHIKKSITTRKNKNKKKTSKPNKKSRKYIKSKRLMKSKVTKPRTYKRRATGGKRKTKPNKTMRRYRRVRK